MGHVSDLNVYHRRLIDLLHVGCGDKGPPSPFTDEKSGADNYKFNEVFSCEAAIPQQQFDRKETKKHGKRPLKEKINTNS